MAVDRRRGLLEDPTLVPPWCAAAMDSWAEWVRTHRDGPGGGGNSVAYRLMRAKELGIASRGTSIEPEMPELLARVDAALARLDKQENKAFCSYYLAYARAEDKARRCRCNVKTFYARLGRARRKVADFLKSGETQA